MKEGYKIVLDVWIEWQCKECIYRQDLKNDGEEEWPMHCGTTMTMQPMKQFKVAKDPNLK